jgi:acetyl esterase/lipase
MPSAVFRVVPVVLGGLLIGLPAVAQDFQGITLDGERATIVPVWPGDVPGEDGSVGPMKLQPLRESEENPIYRLTDVGKPELAIYRPEEEKANGTCVLVCPGGGYHILAYNHEGTEVADWLNSLGVTAAVLKYRVPRRKDRPAHEAPLQDAQRAIRWLRFHAEDYGIAPDRIGILGFSAGGHLTVMAATAHDEPAYEAIDEVDRASCRPDFAIPIYPAYLLADAEDEEPFEALAEEITVDETTPPMFLSVTDDDKDRGAGAARMYLELKKVGVPAELHIFAEGGHGYGMRPNRGPAAHWNERCADWLKVRGWLDPPEEKE